MQNEDGSKLAEIPVDAHENETTHCLIHRSVDEKSALICQTFWQLIDYLWVKCWKMLVTIFQTTKWSLKLLYPFNTPKPKYSSSAIINNKEKQQTFETLTELQSEMFENSLGDYQNRKEKLSVWISIFVAEKYD